MGSEWRGVEGKEDISCTHFRCRVEAGYTVDAVLSVPVVPVGAVTVSTELVLS